MKKIFFIFLFLIQSIAYAEVKIEKFRKKSWDHSWNEAIANALEKEMNSPIMAEPVDLNDLEELGCPGFNKMSSLEFKKDFWIVFFSSLARAESAFNPRAKSIAPKGGHGNYGLLQISKRTAREQCQLLNLEDIFDPKKNLACGVKLLSWQLKGAPAPHGKLLRPDLKNQLFGKYILLWGPMRQNDKKGRALLVEWFKKHLEQMPFCKE